MDFRQRYAVASAPMAPPFGYPPPHQERAQFSCTGTLCAAAFGLMLFVGSFYGIFWNENGAVRVEKSLQEGLSRVREVKLEGIKSAKQWEGELVYASGDLHAGTATDRVFGVSVSGLKLRRRVSMFQCIERRNEIRQEIREPNGQMRVVTHDEYHYNPGWSESLHNQQTFREPERCGGSSPNQFPVSSADFQADSVTLGPFAVSAAVYGSVSSPRPVSLRLPDSKTQAGSKSVERVESSSSVVQHVPKDLELKYNQLQSIGSDIQPFYGAIKVSFDVTPPCTVSVVATVSKGELVPAQSSLGDTISMTYEGHRSAREMFQAAQDFNSWTTWLCRALFWFMMFLGLRMIFSPIPTLLGLFPLLGNLMSALADIGVTLAALLISIIGTLFATSFSWLYARPSLSIALAVAACIPAYWLLFGRHQRSSQPSSGAAARNAAQD